VPSAIVLLLGMKIARGNGSGLQQVACQLWGNRFGVPLGVPEGAGGKYWTLFTVR